MIQPESVREQFFQIHEPNGEQVRLFRAPGRVNLIGEHTDYNDGFVLPVAIDRDTVIAARRRSDSRVNVYSVNEKSSDMFDLSQPARTASGSWLNYVEGVGRVLIRRGYQVHGVDMVILSDVPVGAGLSSSAALEISSAMALLTLSGQTLDRREMALAGQQAEHDYVGTQCGIMDQFISAMGEQDSALLIDCRTLEATSIRLDTTDKALVICDTGVKHDLATSEYNQRRRECEEAVRILKEQLPGITALRDVTLQQFREYEHLLPDVIRRRARHVITENNRTLLAADALRDGDFDTLRDLMYASHESLRSDYEVSARELDVLVDAAKTVPGVFGARMTGGGFGGCTVNIVDRDRLDDFAERISTLYLDLTEKDVTIYNCEIVAGAEEVIARGI